MPVQLWLLVYISSAQHVTEKGKRGITRASYYQLEANNTTVVRQYKLRMNNEIEEELVGGLIKEKVTVLVDENNHSLVYEVTWQDEEGNEHLLLPYEITRDLLQNRAVENLRNPLFWGLGLLLTAIGIFGFWLKHKQRLKQEMP